MPIPDEDLDALSIELFRTFARCEYALKATRFRTGNDRRVDPDWTAFALELGAVFEAPTDVALAAAIDYILAHPPRKQVIRNNALDWSDTAPDSRSQADLVLQYVRRVRNNLFHGDKFNGHWLEPQRSVELLRHSLCILHHAIASHIEVREAFRQH